MLKLVPYVLGFQPECVADGQKGEEPARVVAEEPILSFVRALYARLIPFKLVMKAKKCVFEHGIHQGRLRAHLSELDSRVEKLFGKHGVFEGPIIRCDPVRRPAQARTAAVGGDIGVAHCALSKSCGTVGDEMSHPNVRARTRVDVGRGSNTLCCLGAGYCLILYASANIADILLIYYR